MIMTGRTECWSDIENIVKEIRKTPKQSKAICITDFSVTFDLEPDDIAKIKANVSDIHVFLETLKEGYQYGERGNG